MRRHRVHRQSHRAPRLAVLALHPVAPAQDHLLGFHGGWQQRLARRRQMQPVLPAPEQLHPVGVL